MNADSQSAGQRFGRARLIAGGFIGAFAASVLTVIFTGLMVEGSPSEFDVGFRSVSLGQGETRVIELRFDLMTAPMAARLEVELPRMLEPVSAPGSATIGRAVEIVPGSNVFPIEVRATAAANGYLVARLFTEEPIALERVFVTVEPD